MFFIVNFGSHNGGKRREEGELVLEESARDFPGYKWTKIQSIKFWEIATHLTILKIPKFYSTLCQIPTLKFTSRCCAHFGFQ